MPANTRHMQGTESYTRENPLPWNVNKTPARGVGWVSLGNRFGVTVMGGGGGCLEYDWEGFGVTVMNVTRMQQVTHQLQPRSEAGQRPDTEWTFPCRKHAPGRIESEHERTTPWVRMSGLWRQGIVL